MEDSGLEIEIERLTGVYKNTATGVISLAFRCSPSHNSQTQVSDETAVVDWLTMADATQRMADPFAMRLRDARRESLTRVANVSYERIMEPRYDHD
jgi:hypothetical protein